MPRRGFSLLLEPASYPVGAAFEKHLNQLTIRARKGQVIQQYPLNLNASDVRVISVEDVFERRIFE